MNTDGQGLLFGEGATPGAPLRIEDGSLELIPDWLARDEADALFDALRDAIDWRQESVTMFGQRHLVPRLTAWHGDAGRAYMYSGISNEPSPWTPELSDLRRRVEVAAGGRFNAVLLNLYRSGQDGMGWHADDEPELGPAPLIASISLGATRTFQLRHKRRKDLARVDLDLPHGSLLVMRPPTQAHWLHGVPKRKRGVRGPRINLTFRWILEDAGQEPARG